MRGYISATGKRSWVMTVGPWLLYWLIDWSTKPSTDLSIDWLIYNRFNISYLVVVWIHLWKRDDDKSSGLKLQKYKNTQCFTLTDLNGACGKGFLARSACTGGLVWVDTIRRRILPPFTEHHPLITYNQIKVFFFILDKSSFPCPADNMGWDGNIHKQKPFA